MANVTDIINQIKVQHEVYLTDLTSKATQNLNALRGLLQAGEDNLKVRVVEDKRKRSLSPKSGDYVSFKIDIHDPSREKGAFDHNTFLSAGSNILPHLISSFGTRDGLLYSVFGGYTDNYQPPEPSVKVTDHTKIQGADIESIEFIGSSKDFLDMLNSALTSYGLDIKGSPQRPSFIQLTVSK